MKTILGMLLAISLFPSLLLAQSSVVSGFFKDYGQQKAYHNLNIEGSMMGMMSKDAVDGIQLEGMKLLNAPYGKGPIDGQVVDRFVRSLKAARFEELDIENSGSGSIRFLVDERREVIQELVMVLESEEGFTILSLRGHIPREKLQDINAEIEIDGLEKLEGPY